MTASPSRSAESPGRFAPGLLRPFQRPLGLQVVYCSLLTVQRSRRGKGHCDREISNRPDVAYVVPGCGNKIFFLRVMSSDTFDAVVMSEQNQMVAVKGATAYAIAWVPSN
jgi:hypothetical protein